MIKSMTGFAKVEREWAEGKLTGEAKSLNSRYLEMSLKLPRGDNSQEHKLREVAKRFVSRGKVDIAIRVERTGDQWSVPKVNEGNMQRYVEIIGFLKTRYGLKGAPSVEDILNFRDVITYEEVNSLAEETITGLFEALLKGLDKERIAEGKVIMKDLEVRLKTISRCVKEIQTRQPAIARDHEGKLRQKVEEFTQSPSIDETRLLQELAIYMERLDISEEIVRLKGHIDHFKETLKAKEAVGRKLDFIIQEMVRETNTIGSKANDLHISERVIQIKVEIEKMREQVQNVE